MSCGCNNNSNGSPFGYSPYGSACAPELPYPQVSAESVPSLINNLTTALYGLINKSVVNGKIVWTTPCDGQFPNFTGTVFGISRNAGEGLLCYFLRAFSQTTTTAIIPNGVLGQILISGGNNLLTWLASGPSGYVLTSSGAGSSPYWSLPSVGPTPTPTPSSPTTVRVSTFGAVGDGTTDDTASIQAAINYAISLRNAIVEFDSKKYLVNTPTANPTGYTTYESYNFLHIFGGTTSQRLVFKGNGATIFSNTRTAPASTALIFFATYFENITFDNLNFLRDNGITTSGAESTGGISGNEVDGTPVGDFVIKNCTFTNCHHALNIRNIVTTDRIGKFRSLDVLDCNFIYPFGANTTLTGGGGVICFNSGWIETARYTNCYADGAVNGILPATVLAAKDGFLNVSPLNAIITNCVFKNFAIEGILSNISASVASVNTFSQVAENSATTNITIASGMDVRENLITSADAAAAGDVTKSWYIIISNYSATLNTTNFNPTVGLFQLDRWNGQTSTVNNPQPKANGTPLTFTRLTNSLMGFLPIYWKTLSAGTSVTSQGYGNRLVSFNDYKRFSLKISECRFIGGEILNSNKTNNCFGMNPAIYTELKSIITDNEFIDCSVPISVSGSVTGVPQPVVISDNVFFNSLKSASNPKADLPIQSPISLNSAYSIISGNVFSSNDSTNYLTATILDNNISVLNNTFVINNPTKGTYSTSCLSANNTIANPPVLTICENNASSGYDYFQYAQHGGMVDGFYGTELSTNVRWKTRERQTRCSITKTGWLRLNSPATPSITTAAVAATIQCDRVKFEVIQSLYDKGQINVIRNPYSFGGGYGGAYRAIDSLRLVANGDLCYVDVRISDAAYFNTANPNNLDLSLNVKTYSESGDFVLSTPTESTSIRSITGSGGSGTFTTSYDPTLGNGNYVLVTGSNTVPSVDGCWQISNVGTSGGGTLSTFNVATVSGGQTFPAITSAGSSPTITAYSTTSNVCTVTTGIAHNYAVGQEIYITGSTSNNIDGAWVVASTPTTTSFTFYNPNASTGSTGSISSAELFNQFGNNANVNTQINLASNLIQTCSSGFGDLYGGSNPNGTITPSFLGQCYFNAGNFTWWKASNPSRDRFGNLPNNGWGQLTYLPPPLVAIGPISGSGSPITNSKVPDFFGQEYWDTTNSNWYIAINGGAGGWAQVTYRPPPSVTIGDISGSGSPNTNSVVPSFFGQGYWDTTNSNWWKATGINSGSWNQIS